MDPVTMIVIGLIAFAVMSGLGGGTKAGRSLTDKISTRWDNVTAPSARRSEMGRRAATVGRGLGWLGGAGVRAVRAGIDAIRSRRSAGGGTGATAPKPVDPTVPGAPGASSSASAVHGGDGPTPGVPGPDTAVPGDGSTDPAPANVPGADFVDAADFWPTPPAVTMTDGTTPAPTGSAPALAVTSNPALTAAAPAEEEATMAGEVVATSAAITHTQVRAALARIMQNVAVQNQVATQNANAIGLISAYMEQVKMDPAVQVAVLEAMMTGQQSAAITQQLAAMVEMVSATLTARGHDAVAAVATGLTLADSGYYTG